mmetsp:Transcript_23323/g.52385  ORF Transcript_23323/g.52385 Transcript_23323/m.52385 type:complete len:240 (+) Transcript_23323:4612-5331(+)
MRRGDQELRDIEVHVLRVHGAIRPFITVDAISGDDVVNLPSEHDGIVLALDVSMLLLQHRIGVEQAEMSSADRAGEDVINGVEERLECFDLLRRWVVWKIDGSCVEVSPEGTTQHGSVRREVEQVSLGPMLVDETICCLPSSCKGVNDLLLHRAVEILQLDMVAVGLVEQVEHGWFDPQGFWERHSVGLDRSCDRVVQFPRNEHAVLPVLDALDLLLHHIVVQNRCHHRSALARVERAG